MTITIAIPIQEAIPTKCSILNCFYKKNKKRSKIHLIVFQEAVSTKKKKNHILNSILKAVLVKKKEKNHVSNNV